VTTEITNSVQLRQYISASVVEDNRQKASCVRADAASPNKDHDRLRRGRRIAVGDVEGEDEPPRSRPGVLG
jgi:hypothetical protein